MGETLTENNFIARTSKDRNQGRVAVYIAGDHNIFFPAVVALHSIQKHNPDHPFDFYISFRSDALTDSMKQILDLYNITFVGVDEYAPYGTVDDLETMHEKRWPLEIFYNWVAPYFFADRGYEYALKVDYDILCVGRYTFSDLFSPESTFTALTWDINLFREGLTENHVEALKSPYLIPEKSAYFNAGFVAINLHYYVAGDMYSHFRSAYIAIQSGEGKVNLTEQVALAVAASTDRRKVVRLHGTYNTRIITLPALTDGIQPNIHNIHYITQNKPWKPLDFRFLEAYTANQKTCIYVYRNIWLNYAAELTGFSEFVTVAPPTDLETIGMYTRILASHYRKDRAQNL